MCWTLNVDIKRSGTSNMNNLYAVMSILEKHLNCVFFTLCNALVLCGCFIKHISVQFENILYLSSFTRTESDLLMVFTFLYTSKVKPGSPTLLPASELNHALVERVAQSPSLSEGT